ncbi:MAG: cation-translocating P-type ATPase [Nitrososphaerales archaeon]
MKESLKGLWIFSFSSTLFGIGFLLSYLGFDPLLSKLIHTFSLLIVLAPILIEALKNFMDNPFSTDLLMGIAGISASVIGFLEEAIAILLLYNLAEYLEAYIVDKAKSVTKKVAQLIPQRALRKGSSIQEIRVEDIKVDDIIIVKPGWRIPVDGMIVSGRTLIDNSIITGESLPLEKGEGDKVLSGSLNLLTSIEVKVLKPFKDSTVNRIVNLVIEAKERKTKMERFIDRFSRYYTPSMLLLALLIALIPPLLFGKDFSIWIYRALIALIIACPSALIISVPVTLLMGLTRAMWSGILIKGGRFLEAIGYIKAIIFDKTGTLTQGKLKVKRIIAFNLLSQEEILRMAYEAEINSTHPIAKAIVEEANKRGMNTSSSSNIVSLAGKGIIHEGILIGSLSFLKERGIQLPEINEEGTLVGVAKDGKLKGLIVLKDELRPEAKEVISKLRSKKLRISLLSGDAKNSVKEVADLLKIEDFYSELLPEDKVKIASSLREKYGNIAMVGDGVNDAPVLASSNIGIAINTAENDIAIEASDIALVSNNLRSIPYLLDLSRKVLSKMKINVILALSLKAIMILLGVMGLLPLWVSVLGDDGLTLLLLLNSSFLLRFK